MYYPVNALRNIALKAVQTSFVFLSDIDLIPVDNMHDIVKQHIENGSKLLDKEVSSVYPTSLFYDTI